MCTPRNTVPDTPCTTHPRSRRSPDPPHHAALQDVWGHSDSLGTVGTWCTWLGSSGGGPPVLWDPALLPPSLGPWWVQGHGAQCPHRVLPDLPQAAPSPAPRPGREHCTCRSCWVLGEWRLLNQAKTRPSPRMERMRRRRRMGPMGVRLWRWGMASGWENVISVPAGCGRGLHHSSLAPKGRSHGPP